MSDDKTEQIAKAAAEKLKKTEKTLAVMKKKIAEAMKRADATLKNA